MEIDEVAARVVRSYWALLLAMTLLPLVLAALVMSAQEPPHKAVSRIQASSQATDAAPGDAGVSIVVSQVKAFATSRTLVDRVLREQRLTRDQVELAKRTSVAGLGTSTVVELTIEDADAAVARRLTDAIGTAVVAEINQSNQGAITAQLATIEKRIRELEKRLGPLSRQAGAIPVPDIQAANERERVAAELSDLRTSRTELRTQLSTTGTASVVQPAVLAPRTNPVIMMAAVAGLVGLVAGILIAVVIEMFRPTVPGQSRVSRRLGVPLLGWADRGDAELADLGRRIRLAARREQVGKVALVGAGGPLPPELVSRVAAAVYGDDTKVVNARPGKASSNGNGPAEPGEDGGTNGGGEDAGSDTSVVRAGARSAGTAVIPKKSGEVTSPSEVTQPVLTRSVCHVHAFEDIDPGADDVVGVVAVAGPVTRVSGLESVRDLVTASGWPLLGVAATTRKIKG
ncbi:hypothetical protein [Actinomadura sp. 9N407]|uniref:hypothetical protein n=1 Tax=Actinomadura sp. 9N407 TaxID=3375154 RepID=UPI00378B5F9C